MVEPFNMLCANDRFVSCLGILLLNKIHLIFYQPNDLWCKPYCPERQTTPHNFLETFRIFWEDSCSGDLVTRLLKMRILVMDKVHYDNESYT